MIPYNQADDAQQRATSSGDSTNTQNPNNTQLVTGLRKNNPLSDFSSYTYQLTLYMCTPECIGRFSTNEIFVPNEKENFIIAQSGGISETDLRALTYDGRLTSDGTTGPGYDYYIDDLVFESVAPAGNLPTLEYSFNFKIIEPLGFTLLTKMSNAAKQINLLSPILQQSKGKPNLFQQYYILGIKFYGYDENGNLMSASSDGNNKNSSMDEYAHFQKYYQLIISECKFSINGKAVVYDFQANYLPYQVAYSVTRGLIKKKSTIVAESVGEALMGNNASKNQSSSRSLVQILNEQQFDEKDTGRIKLVNTYFVNFLDDDIKNSKLLDDAEYDLKTVPMSTVKTTDESNILKSIKATTYDSAKKEITINDGSPVLSVIDNIIAKSSYVARALTTINNQAIQTASIDNDDTTELTWYTVIPVAIPKNWDFTNHTWVYDITYNIQKHYIPYIRTLYKNKTNKYYGVHKKYNYVFTGLNTEVINYQAEFNTLFYVIESTSTTSDNPNKKNIDSAVSIYTQGGTNSSVNQGKLNRGSEIASNVKSYLNNITDLATASITIMGDPDFLSQGISAPAKFSSKFYSRLYGTDGYSMNPYGGQIFFEIIFKAAEDYQSDGLLDVNDSISFYEKNDAARKVGIEGIVYRLTKVTSTLAKGRFTQVLDAIIVSENELGFNQNEDTQRIESSNTASVTMELNPTQQMLANQRQRLERLKARQEGREERINNIINRGGVPLLKNGASSQDGTDYRSVNERLSSSYDDLRKKVESIRSSILVNERETDSRPVNQRLRDFFNRF